MRYISLLFFSPQQNQLSSQARKRGVFGRLRAWPGLEKTRPTGGQSEGVRKMGGGEERGGYTNTDGGQQKRRGRGGKREKKREGYSKRGEERWDIHWICINRR